MISAFILQQAFALTARRWVLDATVTIGTIIALLGFVVPADNAMIITALRARYKELSLNYGFKEVGYASVDIWISL